VTAGAAGDQARRGFDHGDHDLDVPPLEGPAPSVADESASARQGAADSEMEAKPRMTEPGNPPVPEPLQRRTYPAAELMRQHPGVLRNENKQVVFAIACPAGAVHSGRLEYSRWPEIPLPLPREVDSVHVARLAVVRDGYYDYGPILDPGVGVEWHVNFADPNLFYAYGSALFAQDEIQVAEHPVLGSLREALLAEARPATTIENGRPTPVLVMGAERRVRIQTTSGAASGGPSWLYGMAFARATTDAVRKATTRTDPPTTSNIIAIVAPYGGRGRYQSEQISLAFSTAYSGFRAAVLESSRAAGPDARVAIHSGFWGCGAFGGNRVMMTLVQLLAADMAGIDRLVLHVGDASGRTNVERALALAPDLVRATSAAELTARVEALGLAWGVTDGN
jgi:Poly (ADP-ribose) glycohydrolase (PARG)